MFSPRNLLVTALIAIFALQAGGLDYKPLPRDKNLPQDVVLVVKAKNIIELLDKVALLADKVQPGVGMVAKAQIAGNVLKNPMLEGLDTTQPSAFVVGIPEGEDGRFAVVMAANNAATALQTMLGNLGVAPADLGGLQKISDKTFMGVAGNNVIISSSEALAKELQTKLANTPLLNSPVTSDIEAVLDVKALVKRYRTDIEQGLAKARDEALQGVANAPGPLMSIIAQLRPFVDFFDEVLPLLDQIDGAVVRIDIDSRGEELKFVSTLYSTENSTLAELIAAQAQADVAAARDLAASIPDGEMVMVFAYNPAKTKEILGKVMTRLRDKYKAATQAPDPLVMLALEKSLEMLSSSENGASVAAMKMDDTGIHAVQAVKAVDLATVRKLVTEFAIAYAQSPLMKAVAETAAQAPTPTPVLKSFQVVDAPEVGGFQVVLDYGDTLNPQMKAAFTKMMGDPPSAYVFAKNGILYRVTSSTAKDVASAVVSGKVAAPLSGGAIYRELFTKTPAGYKAACAMKLLSMVQLGFTMNPEPQLALMAEMLKPFMENDVPILFYASPVGSSLETELHLPVAAVTNISQAFAMIMMGGRGAQAQPPAQDQQEEQQDLGF